jgi:hypothetical protein
MNFFSGLSERFRATSFVISMVEMQFVPSDKGQTIRQPSTANLMLDSADRDDDKYPYASNFVIQKKQSILNGFFTRIGTTEVVLDWGYANINRDLSNNWMEVDVSGSTYVASLVPDFYTVEECFEALVDALNAGAPAGVVWSLNTTLPTGCALECNATFTLEPGPLLFQLYAVVGPVTRTAVAGVALFPVSIRQPNLQPFRYIDFVSEQLTYNQDLKDDSTNNENRSVLCRWYMAFDSPPERDGLGFPILMGYTPFVLRRTFSPPKQIRWDSTQPLGQMGFQLYIDELSAAFYPTLGGNTRFPEGSLADEFDWLMTLQVSEN